VSKRTFEQAFNAVFHDKVAFEDFCTINVQEEVEEFFYDDRKIFRTSKKLKKYLRFIDRVILRHLANDDEVVHSFIKGKSTLTAVKAHTSSKYFFITDIKDFFSNVKTIDVLRILERDKYLVPIDDFENYIDTIVSMTTLGGSIPIGFPTSPQLSNAFLFEFDRKTKFFCADNSLIYTRYADDIIISGQEFNDVAGLKSQIQLLLSEHVSPNLSLNQDKTHITQIGNKVKLLGLVIMPNGRVTIDVKYKNRLETLLHFYVNDKDKFNDLLKKTMKGNVKSLFGLLHYAKSIDPEYLEKLQRKYGVYTIRLLMEDKLSDNR